MHLQDWPFDQPENVACVSDASVVDDGAPILLVIHYSEDHSWAFLSGEPFNPSRGKLISMGEAFKRDQTLRSITDLSPGWTAVRTGVGEAWTREPDDDI
jgi:hypothetical protein